MTTLTFRLFNLLTGAPNRKAQTIAAPYDVRRRDSRVSAWVPPMLWQSLKTTDMTK